ncbi:MAG TPA: XrtA/PEP-CTERM system histidine kinase PrsK [Allosphingosinicella sp.]|nr:XrtA/PEP-CTERM system histidine kinase PrsK [Allosphingosinicella sp.]
MLTVIGLWGNLLAAALYGVLAVFQLRHWNHDPLNRPLVGAFAMLSAWTLFLAFLPGYAMLPQLAEAARNVAFLAFMYGIMQTGQSAAQPALKAVYASVGAAVGLQIVIGGVIGEYRDLPLMFEALAATGQMIGLTIAAGALILVHNLYGQASPASRSALRFPMIALTVMWAYDLHLYTVAYFTRGLAQDLYALRGVVLAMIVPLFLLGVRNHQTWKVQLSRAATFQSVSVIAILAYLIVMMSGARAMELVGGDWGRAAQFGIVLVMSVAALILLPSGRLRGWFKVVVAKHVFEHRYDYREEWLRFTDTVARGDEDSPSLETRVVKALADIGGSPGGLLLLADEHYHFSRSVAWNWDAPLPIGGEGAEALARFVEGQAFVLDFEKLRGGFLSHEDQSVPVPLWLTAMGAWAGVPLVHDGRLLGLVVLAHPPYRRSLDWEDYDLFRASGIQAASYLAEARGQQALADSRRFDEFNRRFAFILHDIKNLVSQLSLVARNAERHADNPEFRTDMIATLQSSVKKMNDMLARLSPASARDGEPVRPVSVQRVAASVAAAKTHQHPVLVAGEPGLWVKADPAALEQALSHLVQNAVEASLPGRPVEVRYSESGGDALIEVIDRGHGMTAEFVRTRLFQPFVSTKEQGFGIGAYEARTLVNAMGGRLEVDSREGQGTVFSLIFPQANAFPVQERKRMRA